MSGLISGLFKLAGRGLQQISASRQFHALASVPQTNSVAVSPATNQWSLDCVRTIVRNNFPKPSERKRVKKHGWKARLSTVSGRRVIMRRILKERFNELRNQCQQFGVSFPI